MPKLFDEFDLDLQKVDEGIKVYSSDDTTLGSECMSGGSSISTQTLGWECITVLICPSNECSKGC